MPFQRFGVLGRAIILMRSDTIEWKNIRGGTITAEVLIIAGGTNGVIRSENFEPGVAGWAIFGDGSAEFFDILVRGDIISSNWDGLIPTALPDLTATTGFYLDSSAGDAQFMGDIFVGGSFYTSDDITTDAHIRITSIARSEVGFWVGSSQEAFIRYDGSGGIDMHTDTDGNWTLLGDDIELRPRTGFNVRISTDGGSDAQLLHESGAVGTPSYSFAIDPDTGILRPTTNTVAISCGNSTSLTVTATTVDFHAAVLNNVNEIFADGGTNTDASYTFDGDGDTGLYRLTTNVPAITGGGVRHMSFGADVQLGVATTGYASLKANATPSATRPAYSFVGDEDSGMYRSSTNRVSIAVSAAERFRIAGSTGNIIGSMGIGESGTRALLVASSSTTVALKVIRNTGSSGSGVFSMSSNFGGTDTQNAFMTADGDWFNTNGTYSTISDRRLKVKASIQDARPYLEDLRRLRVRNYRFKRMDQKLLGFVADEVQEVFPGLVKETDSENVDHQILSVKTSVLIPMLVTAVQELADRVEELEAQLAQA